MKKIISIILLMAIFVSGCTDNSKNAFNVSINEIPDAALTFDQAVSSSKYIAEAEFVKFYKKGLYVEHEFKVTNILYGNISDSNIFIYTYLPKATDDIAFITDAYYVEYEKRYTKNEKYILIMNKETSIFYEHDRYTLLGDIFIPESAIDKSEMYGKILFKTNNKSEEANIIGYINAIKQDNKDNKINDNEEANIPEDIKTAVAEADLILEVEIINLSAEGQIQNSDTYSCNPIKKLKGENYNKNDDGSIEITLIRDLVKIGEEYVILLDYVDDNSLLYTQSSKLGIIPITDTDKIIEIESYLK